MLTDKERAALAAIADVLIPAHREMPSFSLSGAHLAHTDRVLALRQELLPVLRAALSHVNLDVSAEAMADRLNRDHPEAIGVIGVVASAAYYLDEEVRQKLGYPGQIQRPAGDEEEYDYEALLQPVIGRGRIYRPTPNKEE
jgi:hypothetical protein